MVAKGGSRWHLARSLVRFFEQADDAHPHRSYLSDGSIASSAHSVKNPTSDHEIRNGIVTAGDITHDPAHGLDCNKLAAQLAASRDPRIKYVIWNWRILDSRPGYHPWQWMPYRGSNGHTKHLHLSVLMSRADDASAWDLPILGGTTAPPPVKPITPKEHPMAGMDDKDGQVIRRYTGGGVLDAMRSPEYRKLMTSAMAAANAPLLATLQVIARNSGASAAELQEISDQLAKIEQDIPDPADEGAPA